MKNDHGYYVILDILSFGFWIIPPLVLSFFFAWKAVRWLRNHGTSDGVVTEESKDPWDQAISRPAADYNYWTAGGCGGGMGGLGGMNRREQDDSSCSLAPGSSGGRSGNAVGRPRRA